MMNNNPMQIGTEEKEVKKENKFARFIKGVFVNNIVAKITAVIISAALWVLAVGLA